MPKEAAQSICLWCFMPKEAARVTPPPPRGKQGVPAPGVVQREAAEQAALEQRAAWIKAEQQAALEACGGELSLEAAQRAIVEREAKSSSPSRRVAEIRK